MKQKVLWGALAGGAGGLAMKAIVRLVDRHSFGLSAETDAKSAHELWARLNWGPLEQRTAEKIGAAMHYGFSVAAGAAYAVCSERWPMVRAGSGALFGAGLWLVGDEIAVSAAGLEDPWRTRPASHVSALAAHIAYGVVVENTLSQLSRAR